MLEHLVLITAWWESMTCLYSAVLCCAVLWHDSDSRRVLGRCLCWAFCGRCITLHASAVGLPHFRYAAMRKLTFPCLPQRWLPRS